MKRLFQLLAGLFLFRFGWGLYAAAHAIPKILAAAEMPRGGKPPDDYDILAMLLMGAFMILLVVSLVTSALLAWFLAVQRQRTLCLVLAWVSCLDFYLGTILGIATLIALRRPKARELFTAREPGSAG